MEFLNNHNTPLVLHPSNSPNLAPREQFSVLQRQKYLKWKLIFKNVPLIIHIMILKLNDPEEA
jgi:hypothetical protein